MTVGRTTRTPGPSAWRHRLPVFGLALLGAAISTYLTLYQWHVTTGVWDPVFGAASSERVLTSSLSRALPLPDATLGATAYLVEAVVTIVGDSRRSESRPWLVALYGVVLAALAVTSIVLVLAQIALVHAFCTLCLASAAISIINPAIGRPEVAAAVARLTSERAPA